MVKILRAYGVTSNLVQAIETMYRDTRAKANSTEQDIKVRKTLAWRAVNGMKSVWKSYLS